jgi:hypothetical protein
MAKDKNVELQRKQIYLANTVIRKQARKDKRKSSWRMKYKECPDCGGQMVWCCDMWSRVCCYEYGTCPCS